MQKDDKLFTDVSYSFPHLQQQYYPNSAVANCKKG